MLLEIIMLMVLFLCFSIFILMHFSVKSLCVLQKVICIAG